MEQIGLRIYDKAGYAPSLKDWYPAVADLFQGCFWAASHFQSSPFFGLLALPADEFDEIFDRIVVQGPPVEYRCDPILYKPEALERYYEFFHLNDWVILYGIAPEQVPSLLERWYEPHLGAALLEMAEPLILNPDGWWWDIITIHRDEVKRRLDTLENIEIQEVTLEEYLKYFGFD